MPTAEIESPSRLRVALTFVLAPPVAAFAFSCVSPLYAGLPNIFERIIRTFPFVLMIGGYLPTLFLGVPAYLLLRNRLRPTILNCVITGAAVAGLPWLVLSVLPTGAASASVDGVSMVVLQSLAFGSGWSPPLDLACLEDWAVRCFGS